MREAMAGEREKRLQLLNRCASAAHPCCTSIGICCTSIGMRGHYFARVCNARVVAVWGLPVAMTTCPRCAFLLHSRFALTNRIQTTKDAVIAAKRSQKQQQQQQRHAGFFVRRLHLENYWRFWHLDERSCIHKFTHCIDSRFSSRAFQRLSDTK
jgi:hypothetical protein